MIKEVRKVKEVKEFSLQLEIIVEYCFVCGLDIAANSNLSVRIFRNFSICKISIFK